MKLSPNKKLDVTEILKDLENYRPRRKGWVWRKPVPEHKVGPFQYKNTSADLLNSVPLQAAHYFDDIDPQCDCVITTEIASGRFEDDLRRMRMAAWHGADHIMVIRTTGQSHIDGLVEGTPEGIGGIPISRKQIRATRKALDAIEDEVGRPINFHSYVSGVAGPEIAVLFAEEGVNGAHQDPQYNILYRDINMHRSLVDAGIHGNRRSYYRIDARAFRLRFKPLAKTGKGGKRTLRVSKKNVRSLSLNRSDEIPAGRSYCHGIRG